MRSVSDTVWESAPFSPLAFVGGLGIGEGFLAATDFDGFFTAPVEVGFGLESLPPLELGRDGRLRRPLLLAEFAMISNKSTVCDAVFCTLSLGRPEKKGNLESESSQ